MGDKIATLVSLSLTPLVIEEIHEMRPTIDQVDITGQAILFQSGIYAVLPDDMPEGLALSALDVAGAPAQAAKLAKPGDTILVIGGGGKSGLLCLYEAKKRAGVTGKVICAAGSQKSEDRARKLDLAYGRNRCSGNVQQDYGTDRRQALRCSNQLRKYRKYRNGINPVLQR